MFWCSFKNMLIIYLEGIMITIMSDKKLNVTSSHAGYETALLLTSTHLLDGVTLVEVKPALHANTRLSF